MEYRKVVGTDLEVSRVVMGTMTFGSQVQDGAAKRMVDCCLDAGINMFDTANAYNGGESERMLGRALSGRRDRVLIATKVFNPMGHEPEDRGLSRPAIHRAIDGSLERLGTEHVDVYYMHQPDPHAPIEETLEAMNELVSRGKVRHFGVSNYAAWQICEIACICDRRGFEAVRISQQMYNLLARRIEEEYASFSERFGTFDIAYNPLAGGLLTGKHRFDSSPSEGTRFSTEMYRRRYWNRLQFEAVETLRQTAKEREMTLVELSFRWLLTRRLVDAVLVGASSVEQIETNLAACEAPPLDPDVLQPCDDAWEGLRGVAPAYNR